MKPLPVTVVSGFVGVGKSTLIRHLQAQATGIRLGVPANGADLLPMLQTLVESDRYDHLLLEAPATLEPAYLVEALLPAAPPARLVRIDTLVTVVDAGTFLEEYTGSDYLVERGLTQDSEDDRIVVDLLVDQIEFANVIVLNKAEEVPPRAADLIVCFLRRLNPLAEILTTSQGQIPPDKVLNTGRFCWDSVEEAEAAFEDAQGAETTAPDTHGLSTLVYQARRPFHPVRFQDVVETPHAGLLRLRGIFWLCTRMAEAGRINLAGAAGRIESAGYWLAALPDDEAQADPEQWQAAQAIWDGEWGDRRQDLVFIGLNLDHAALKAGLDAALLTDAEMNRRPAAWAVFEDPFGKWDSPEEAD